MDMTGSVIVAYVLPLSRHNRQWCIVEVPYQSSEGTSLRFGDPLVLSVTDAVAQKNLVPLFAGLLTAKGAFFIQVTRAIRSVGTSKKKQPVKSTKGKKKADFDRKWQPETPGQVIGGIGSRT